MQRGGLPPDAVALFDPLGQLSKLLRASHHGLDSPQAADYWSRGFHILSPSAVDGNWQSCKARARARGVRWLVCGEQA
jgi:hypothetical protein